MFKEFLTAWLKTYFSFVRNLSAIGVVISSFFVNPGDASLYLMTINELYQIQ